MSSKQGGKSGSWITVSSDPHRILWIRDISRIRQSREVFGSGISRIYRGSRGYGGDPRIPWESEDTMGIQKIQRIRLRSRESKRYCGDPENPKDSTGTQGIRYPQYLQCIVCIVKVSAVSPTYPLDCVDCRRIPDRRNSLFPP